MELSGTRSKQSKKQNKKIRFLLNEKIVNKMNYLKKLFKHIYTQVKK